LLGLRQKYGGQLFTEFEFIYFLLNLSPILFFKGMRSIIVIIVVLISLPGLSQESGKVVEPIAVAGIGLGVRF
jgi:hypothetical protein